MPGKTGQLRKFDLSECRRFDYSLLYLQPPEIRVPLLSSLKERRYVFVQVSVGGFSCYPSNYSYHYIQRPSITSDEANAMIKQQPLGTSQGT